ncbi:hypothetical protein LQF12_06700 [Ruania suaedae]|uniref:hypothetical protein n=1 Tax=Ruania suaedae TaxID=2897774 RepID=UPI001E4C97C6|nr:hypothetical protein [Ruania suaedae]UFU04264.1 hypothetical protein LQF12_06700 [Ruania suaedae]
MKRSRPRQLVAWLTTAILAVAGLLAGGTVPASASTGGSAHALAVDAVVADLQWDVQVEGAAGALSGLLDTLAGQSAVDGLEVRGVEAQTPPAPEGGDGEAVGPYEIGSLLTFRQVNAHSTRVEDGDLSARSTVEGGTVDLLGTQVLDIGTISAAVAMAPEGEAQIERQVRGLEVFGRQVGADPQVDLTRELTSADVLDALTEQVPGLTAAADVVGAAVSGGGSIHVLASGRDSESADGADAVGLHLSVSTEASLRLCLPDGSGGCTGSVTVSAAATVLDATFAEVRVERPDPVPGVPAWQIVAGVVGSLVLAGLLGWAIVETVRIRRRGERP